jgi:hypothetical protein
MAADGQHDERHHISHGDSCGVAAWPCSSAVRVAALGAGLVQRASP